MKVDRIEIKPNRGKIDLVLWWYDGGNLRMRTFTLNNDQAFGLSRELMPVAFLAQRAGQ